MSRTAGAKHLVLIGLMGVGKTSVGQECARRLQRPFVDTDDLVATAAALSVADIFATKGEVGFRTLERIAVADVCASPQPLVVACGGGTVLDPDNRRALRAAGLVFWLRAPTATLLTRVGDGSARPLLQGDPEASLTRLGRLRQMTYEAASHVSVDTEERDIGEVADAVLAGFEGGPA